MIIADYAVGGEASETSVPRKEEARDKSFHMIVVWATGQERKIERDLNLQIHFIVPSLLYLEYLITDSRKGK